MRRFFLSLGLAIAAQVLPGFSLADSDLTGSRWTVVVAEQCQLGQIEEIQLQAGGIARGTALVESSNSSGTAGENSNSTDLEGSWSYAGNLLHLSFNDGSLTLDGPVKNRRFMAKAAMKTDLGDSLQQDCMLKQD
jgi:hypothetical protein